MFGEPITIPFFESISPAMPTPIPITPSFGISFKTVNSAFFISSENVDVSDGVGIAVLERIFPSAET